MIRELELLQVPLTPSVAKEHQRLPQIEGDRRLRPDRVAKLTAKLHDGLFHSPSWVVAYHGRKKYRIDGKHSSHVLCESNGSFPSGLFATIRQFDVDSLSDLVVLYEQFDTKWSVRTDGDCMQVHKSLHPELSEISPTMCTSVTAGITYALSQDGAARLDGDEQRRLVHDHCDFVLWAKQFVGTRRMKKPGVVAAMFATRARDTSWADIFWPMVRDESHENKDHPTRSLGEFLKLACYDKTDSMTGRPWTTRALYVKSIHAWNADRRGHRTDLKYHPKSPWPRVV